MTSDPVQPLLRTPDAALLLGLSARTLEKHRCYGTGPAYRKLGGRVVYATCSVLEAENDDVIADAPPELEQESRHLLLPHRDGGDGFFIACFRRRRSSSTSPRRLL